MAVLLFFWPVVVLPGLLMVFASHFNAEGWLTAFAMSLGVAMAGAIILCYSKWPLYRANRFLEFGAEAIPDQRKRAYQWAWRFIAIGVFFSVCLLLLGHYRFHLGML